MSQLQLGALSVVLLAVCGCGDGKNTELMMLGPGVEVSFSVDGGDPITLAGNSRRVVKVKEGEHTLEVTAPATLKQTVTVGQFERWVLPVVGEQCFGELDVSLSHYGKRHKKMAPSMRKLRSEKAPFKLARGYYLHPNDLPASNQDGKPVWLFRSASCQKLAAVLAAQQKIDAELAAKRNARRPTANPK